MAPPCPGDGGFSLIEVVIAMVIIASVAASMAMLFISGMRSAATLQHKQTAISVAGETMELVRSVSLAKDAGGCVPLLAGRSATAVAQQWAAPPTGITLSDTDQASSPSGCSATIAVPFAGMTSAVTDDGVTPAVTRSGVGYVVRTWIGTCSQPLTGGACSKAATVTVPASTLYRAIVDVTWSAAGCTVTTCQYILSTLLDPSIDPVFSLRSSTAPVAAPDTACTSTGRAVLINLLTNDTGALTSAPVTVMTGPAHGTLSSTVASGIGSYTPASGWTGADTFSYRLTDVSGLLSGTTTVTVTTAASC